VQTRELLSFPAHRLPLVEKRCGVLCSDPASFPFRLLSRIVQ
jgi:hypothetical protein